MRLRESNLGWHAPYKSSEAAANVVYPRAQEVLDATSVTWFRNTLRHNHGLHILSQLYDQHVFEEEKDSLAFPDTFKG